ncbi:MAG: hypothetical protein IKF65_01645 [Clostridia bacterium]|nr:hypothetical protein [Clostridia bacterium]
MGNESAVNLIDRIIADAREAAAKVLADAEASCNSIRETTDAEIARKAEQFEKDRAQQTKAVIDGYKTRAELDGKKEALRDKRALLDSVFDEAYRKLLDLPVERREKLYLSILKTEAKENDVIAPAKPDREAVVRAAKQLPFRVRIDERDADAEAGFILYGGSYEKDCSMKSVLRELRDAEETNVAKILFR